MIKGIIIFFLDLLVASIASKLIDLFWGNQPESTPLIIFVILGGIFRDCSTITGILSDKTADLE